MNGQHRAERERGHEKLLEAIAQEEARHVRLEAEQADSKCRLAALRAELAALGAEPEIRVRLPVVVEAAVPRTSAEKVTLFRSLFRGRGDVFPTRFVSKKTGKPGYAPACRNKFVKGVCELPKVKCGDCPNQAFVPFDDAAVVGHLTGRHVMGVQQITTDNDWTAVWSGLIRMCASRPDASIWCWAWDETRMGGVNYTTIMKQTPQQVHPNNMAWSAFVPGAALQSCLADATGGLSCWGPNVFGEVGDGTATPVASPMPVPGGPWHSASVAGTNAGWAGAHSCALQNSGALFCWGRDSFDQFGFPASSPVVTPTVVGTTTWKEIGTGVSYTCGIQSDGTIWCWGYAFDPKSPGTTTQPWQVSVDTDWTGLSAGAGMACALRGDASAWCWGSGSLGSANAPSWSNAPVHVGVVASWSSIAVGLDQACGLDQNSMLWCWGNNFSGQVGNGTLKPQVEPTPIM